MESYKPKFISKNQFRRFLTSHQKAILVDAFSKQVKELFLIRNPRYASEQKERIYQMKEFKKYAKSKKGSYIYVYYSWNNHLVKTVDASDYFVLKTNRNRDLITETEQKKLYNYRIAIFGMSVGSNIAFVLTQAGISKEITIADFDDLDTTNLNRVLGGVHQIGLNKTILAARKIYEDNPFAKVNILSKGINEKTLKNILVKKKIDCMIDEIDAIPMKIIIRKLAIEHKIPVLMATDNGDGIVLHIERYDMGYKKIFHKNLNYWQKKLALFAVEKRGDKKLAGGVIMDDIVGGAHLVDPKMLQSVKKVLDKKLVSWSQLGSAAILGGVYVTFALKQIILGRDKRKEVRTYINPHF